MSKKLLIVDDSSFARSKIKKALSSFSFEMFEAASGQEAIELVKNTEPDIITLDLLMPEMTGQEALAAIRKISQACKVIVVTADIQVQTQAELLNLGANAFLNKPVKAEELVKTIESLID